MQFSQELIKEKIKTLPADVQEALSSIKTSELIYSVAKKYGLLIDKSEILADEVTFLMIGLLKPQLFVENLKHKLEINDETATNIVEDINKQVLLPIRESIVKMNAEEKTQEEKGSTIIETTKISSESAKPLIEQKEKAPEKIAYTTPRELSQQPHQNATPSGPKKITDPYLLNRDRLLYELENPSTIKSTASPEATPAVTPPISNVKPIIPDKSPKSPQPQFDEDYYDERDQKKGVVSQVPDKQPEVVSAPAPVTPTEPVPQEEKPINWQPVPVKKVIESPVPPTPTITAPVPPTPVAKPQQVSPIPTPPVIAVAPQPIKPPPVIATPLPPQPPKPITPTPQPAPQPITAPKPQPYSPKPAPKPVVSTPPQMSEKDLPPLNKNNLPKIQPEQHISVKPGEKVHTIPVPPENYNKITPPKPPTPPLPPENKPDIKEVNLMDRKLAGVSAPPKEEKLLTDGKTTPSIKPTPQKGFDPYREEIF